MMTTNSATGHRVARWALTVFLMAPVTAPARRRRDPVTTTTTVTTTTATSTSSTTPTTCPSTATFDAVTCDLDALATLLTTAPDVGPTKAVMLSQLGRAQRWVTEAGGTSDRHKEMLFLEHAVTALRALNFRARSFRGRQTIGHDTRAQLQMLAETALTDVERLQTSADGAFVGGGHHGRRRSGR